jgi:protein SCO1
VSPVRIAVLVALAATAPTASTVRVQYWPNGRPRLEARYDGEVLHGRYRTWYRSGALFEDREYDHGRESGLQRSYTEDGKLFLNYEARGGRRYGYVNARPCLPVHAGAALPYYDSPELTPRWEPVAHRVADFDLVTQKGAPLRATDLDGKIHVASFVFAQCPSVCPTLLKRLARVQEAARDWPDVALVSFSVTPTADTPAVLAELGRRRGVDPTRWFLLTGDAGQIGRLARTSYFANDDREGEGRLIHTEKVLLVDGDRRLRGVYNGTLAFDVERLLEDIATLRAYRLQES